MSTLHSLNHVEISDFFEQAKIWYEKAAAQGNSYAKANLGWMLFLGSGSLQCDHDKSFDLFNSAAHSGIASAEEGANKSLI